MIAAFLRLIPLRDWLYLAIIVVLLTGAALFIHRERQIGASLAKSQLEHERAAVAAAGVQAAAIAASETERRIAAIQEIAHATQVAASAVVADAAIARSQRDAAVVQLHAYVRASSVSASAPATSASAPTEDGLLAGLLEACWNRNLSLAAEADERGVAGKACEQAYDALNPH